MKYLRLHVALLVAVVAVVTGHGQTVPVPKDASAVAVLARMSAVTGWVRAAVPSDAVITGTVIRHFSDGDASAAFTVKIRGDQQYRYSEDGTPVALVASGAAGVVVGRDSKAVRMPAHSALGSRGFVLPMASVLSDWNAPDVEVTSVGQSTVNGEACVGIQIARRHPESDPFVRVRRLLAPVVVWVSSTRGLPVRVDYVRVAIDNHNATIPESVLFSDYRVVNGMAVPFQQDILLGEQRIQTLQLSSVQLNRGLTDGDFNVAAIVGGAR